MAPVLVVENDPTIRQMLQVMLDLEGYRVRSAPGGAAGLAVLRASDEPHVVLVNYLMPDVDGFAVLAAAVADPALSRHRYVLMSSCTSGLREPRVCVPYGLLMKPFTMEGLLSSVEAAANTLAAAGRRITTPLATSDVRRREDMRAGATVEGRDAGQSPLLLTFAAQTAISRQRGRIVVRTRPGAIVTLAVRDESGRELWRPELGGARMADELGYCHWRWIHRARGGELMVEAHAEWRGQHAAVARSFALGQPWHGGR